MRLSLSVKFYQTSLTSLLGLGGCLYPTIGLSSSIQPPEAQTRLHRSALAQAPNKPSPPAAPSNLAPRRGSQISINGRTYAASWLQWGTTQNPEQVQTAISDLSAAQVLGLELLSSPDIRQQTIKWFSNTIALPTLRLEQQRFLNVTSLLQSAGWQTSIEGETLLLTAPLTQIAKVDWSRNLPGDRTIVALDRPTAWQSNWQGSDLILTLEGTPNPALVEQLSPSLESIARNALQHSPAPEIQTTNGQTQIRIPVAQGLYPTITTLANPPRLIIDTTTTPIPQRDIAWAAGLRWRQKTIQVGQARFPVIWLAVNPRQPGLAIRPFWSNPPTQVGTAPLATTARLWQAVAAINAGFFNRNNQLPLGVIRRDGRWASGPILHRGAIAWNNRGEIGLGRFRLQESLRTNDGKQFPVIALNSGYVQAGISRYTPDWGATYSPILNDEILIGVQNQQVIGYAEGGPAGQNAFPIPPNGYLLVLRSNKSALASFPLNSVVTLESQADPSEFSRFPHIVGAGPLLIQNRQIVLDAAAEKFSPAFIRETAVRSAIGRTATGELILVAVQSQPYGAEPSLQEMAKIMEQLGAIDALNLDGGSSTTLYLGGWVLNRSAQSSARVHNGIGIFLEP